MTRDNANKLLPIIEAYAEGKEIEFLGCDGVWNVVPKIANLSFDDKPEHYRIKPEPKYRPFESAEECWAEMQKHHPFGWVRRHNEEPMDADEESENYQEKGYYGYYHIEWVYKAYIFIDGHEFFFYPEIPQEEGMSVCMDYYTFADGAPFGIKVEEEEK